MFPGIGREFPHSMVRGSQPQLIWTQVGAGNGYQPVASKPGCRRLKLDLPPLLWATFEARVLCWPLDEKSHQGMKRVSEGVRVFLS